MLNSAFAVNEKETISFKKKKALDIKLLAEEIVPVYVCVCVKSNLNAKVKGHTTAMTNTIYFQKKASNVRVFRLNLLTFYIFGLELLPFIQDIFILTTKTY